MASRAAPSLLEAAWREEIESYEPEQTDFDIIESADLPDELADFEAIAEDDPTFWDAVWEWHFHVMDCEIWLPLEQSCYQGLLLPMETRIMRLQSCPESLLRRLRWFFELCPEAVKHYVSYYNYLFVRVERGRRTGNADWQPRELAQRDDPVTLFKWGGRSFHRRRRG
jgi:hypothetical protein